MTHFYDGYTCLCQSFGLCVLLLWFWVHRCLFSVPVDVIICLFPLLNGLDPEFFLSDSDSALLLSVYTHWPAVIFHMPFFSFFFRRVSCLQHWAEASVRIIWVANIVPCVSKTKGGISALTKL